jgi:predicted dehydrogenase
MTRITLIGPGSQSRSCHPPARVGDAEDHAGRNELVAACDLDRRKARTFAGEYGFNSVSIDYSRMIGER